MPTDQNNERLDWGPYIEGESGWASDTEAEDGKSGLAELLDLLERDVPIKDAESAIESYRPLSGRTFVPTDANVERRYRGDGTQWVQLRTTGNNPTVESLTVEGATNTGEVLTKTQDSHIHYESQYADLAAALSASSEGDMIILQPETYAVDTTIPQRRTLIGSGVGLDNTAQINGSWTIEGGVQVRNVAVGNDTTVTVTGNSVQWHNGAFGFRNSKIEVDANNCIFTGLNNGEVVFKANTRNDVIDNCVRTAVTDNGSNTVGDIA